MLIEFLEILSVSYIVHQLKQCFEFRYRFFSFHLKSRPADEFSSITLNSDMCTQSTILYFNHVLQVFPIVLHVLWIKLICYGCSIKTVVEKIVSLETDNFENAPVA